MGRFKYYYCWEKRGPRRWLVRAVNAEHARQILSNILQEEVTVEQVRCWASSCRQHGACGQQVVELPPQGSLQQQGQASRPAAAQQQAQAPQPSANRQQEEVADAAVQAVLYYMKPKKAVIYLCRSPFGRYMFCWEHEIGYYRDRGWHVERLT